jgi:glycosyltransferase involved in cell wall biosynthesis
MTVSSILIPAHNEADYLGDCLSALLASDPAQGVEVIVVPNACTDATPEIAASFAPAFRARGWDFEVLSTPQPGKLHALNLGDQRANGAIRIYLDADVTVAPDLIPAMIQGLNRATPAYASGTPEVWTRGNWAIRSYARFWQTLPFLRSGVPGFGIFAVNAAGRTRWGAFPDIISDDTFVRLQFAPSERIRLAETYRWPMVDTLPKLIRVRRRQDVGVAEVADLFPALSGNDAKTRPGLAGSLVRLLRDPLGFIVYGAVSLAVKLPILRSETRWVRGR